MHPDLHFKRYSKSLLILKAWNAKPQEHLSGISVSIFPEKRISSLNLLNQAVIEASVL